jgi:hypothetical protein
MRDTEIMTELGFLNCVQFLAEAVITLPGGVKAFIDAEGLDVLSSVHSMTSRSDTFVDIRLHPGKPRAYIWASAADVLSEDAQAIEHPILAVLPNKTNLYRPVWSPAFGQLGTSFPRCGRFMFGRRYPHLQQLEEYQVVILGATGKPAF